MCEYCLSFSGLFSLFARNNTEKRSSKVPNLNKRKRLSTTFSIRKRERPWSRILPERLRFSTATFRQQDLFSPTTIPEKPEWFEPTPSVDIGTAKPGYFCVYNTTTTGDDTTLVKALNRGQFENSSDQTQWSIPEPPFPSQQPSAILAHHRQSSGVLDKQYLVISDRSDWASSTVLAVNLDFQGYEDAVRMQVGVAGDLIPSMSNGNTEWEENFTSKTWPKERFAVYVTPAEDDDVNYDMLVNTLNAGLNARKAWTTGGNVCRNATGLLPEDGWKDLATVRKAHGEHAEKEGFDPGYFIVADQADWEADGVKIVRSAGQDFDERSKPAESAAEILTWVNQGLYTWEEGKEWCKRE